MIIHSAKPNALRSYSVIVRVVILVVVVDEITISSKQQPSLSILHSL